MPTQPETLRQLAAVREELALARAELATAQAEAASRAAELKDVYASTSWRLSAPVRTLGRLLKRLSKHAVTPPPSREERPRLYFGEVYGLARHIADCFGSYRIMDLGGGDTQSVVSGLPDSDLREAVVVCAGALLDLPDPIGLSRTLREALEYAPYAVVATLPRERAEGAILATEGNPAGQSSPDEFLRLLESAGSEVMFHGSTTYASDDPRKNAAVAIIRKPLPVVTPPPGFRVLAIIDAYNEEDVIGSTIEHLVGQGVEIHLVDNWSTDRTAEIARSYLGRGVVDVSRFPDTGSTGTYEWYAQLEHVQSLAHRSDVDWVLRVDADEIRESPWPGVSLREALYRVQSEGFNAIDHTVLDFQPTGEAETDSLTVQERLRYFEFGRRAGHFCQTRGWKPQPAPVELAWSGGHEVRFPGRRTYPFKFLLRHYPIRSQEHGEKKILAERMPRVTRYEREVRGWHGHHQILAAQCSFVRDKADLIRFEEQTFCQEYLVERLSGVGIIR